MVQHLYEGKETGQIDQLYDDLGKVMHRIPLGKETIEPTGEGLRHRAAFYIGGDGVDNISVLAATHAHGDASVHRMAVTLLPPTTELPPSLKRIVDAYHLEEVSPR